MLPDGGVSGLRSPCLWPEHCPSAPPGAPARVLATRTGLVTLVARAGHVRPPWGTPELQGARFVCYRKFLIGTLWVGFQHPQYGVFVCLPRGVRVFFRVLTFLVWLVVSCLHSGRGVLARVLTGDERTCCFVRSRFRGSRGIPGRSTRWGHNRPRARCRRFFHAHCSFVVHAPCGRRQQACCGLRLWWGLFLRERERELEWGVGAEGETVSCRLPTERGARRGARCHSPEITT